MDVIIRIIIVLVFIFASAFSVGWFIGQILLALNPDDRFNVWDDEDW